MAKEAKGTKLEDWITSSHAAALLTEKSGHAISIDYVRQLGRNGKVEKRILGTRTVLYSRADVEGYTVKQRGNGTARRKARPNEYRHEKEAC